MADRASMNEVKLRVRQKALLLEEFTVADIVGTTGLNPESVRTELQRMKKDKLLTSHPIAGRPQGPGGVPYVYRLTEDPEVRLELVKSLEVFLPPLPLAEKPSTPHYYNAQKLLDEAQGVGKANQASLLSRAALELEVAVDTEGGELAPSTVKAYLEFEQARLAFLQEEYIDAKIKAQEVRSAFAGINEDACRRVDEFLLNVERVIQSSTVTGLTEAQKMLGEQYVIAQRLINQALSQDNSYRRQFLDEAEAQLQLVNTSTGNWYYLEYEYARIDFAKGRNEEAIRKFERIKKVFIDKQDIQTTDHINEYIICIEARNRMMTELSTNISAQALAKHLLEVLDENAYQTNSPLVLIMIQLVRGLSQNVREEITSSAFELHGKKLESIDSQLEDLRSTVISTLFRQSLSGGTMTGSRRQDSLGASLPERQIIDEIGKLRKHV